MNINTAVMALNVNNVLVKRQLDKDVEDKSALKINGDVELNENVKVDELTTNENLVAAESDIKNVDMAEKLLKLTKDSILEKSAMALLSQANQQPQQILSLLQ